MIASALDAFNVSIYLAFDNKENKKNQRNSLVFLKNYIS